MKNWVSTICPKVWRRILPPRPNNVAHTNTRRINSPFPERAPPPPAERGHKADALTPHHPKAAILACESIISSCANGEACQAYHDHACRRGYLVARENCDQDIAKLNRILRMPQVLMEIGCGNADAATQIALKNPDMGIIATDLYDWSHPRPNGSGYGQVAHEWRDGQLLAQVNTPANLVILRAETDLLHCFPIQAIDSIILINPEPLVGKSILALLQGELLSLRMKHGPLQIVILPYSREMGLMACGGFGFEHDPDWSRGLGFMMESGLRFKRGASIQWGVDLSRLSAYTGNSTQRGVYIYGKHQI